MKYALHVIWTIIIAFVHAETKIFVQKMMRNKEILDFFFPKENYSGNDVWKKNCIMRNEKKKIINKYITYICYSMFFSGNILILYFSFLNFVSILFFKCNSDYKRNYMNNNIFISGNQQEIKTVKLDLISSHL